MLKPASVVLLAGLASPAAASIEVWTATGTLTTIAETPGFLGGATDFTILMTIDTATPDLDGASNVGQYAITAELTIGSINETFGSFFYVADASTDQAAWGDPNLGSPPSGWTQLGFVFDLGGPSSLFSGDGIPAQLPDFSTFGASSTSIIMQGFQTGGNGFQASGSVTSLTVTPAPASLTVLALGCAAARRRR